MYSTIAKAVEKAKEVIQIPNPEKKAKATTPPPTPIVEGQTPPAQQVEGDTVTETGAPIYNGEAPE